MRKTKYKAAKKVGQAIDDIEYEEYMKETEEYITKKNKQIKDLDNWVIEVRAYLIVIIILSCLLLWLKLKKLWQ